MPHKHPKPIGGCCECRDKDSAPAHVERAGRGDRPVAVDSVGAGQEGRGPATPETQLWLPIPGEWCRAVDRQAAQRACEEGGGMTALDRKRLARLLGFTRLIQRVARRVKTAQRAICQTRL